MNYASRLKKIATRRVSALLPVILTMLVLSQFHANGQTRRTLSGKIISGGQTYKSRNHVFTVVLPQPTAFEPMPYSIHEDAKKGEYETAEFFIFDFGEMYSAGILQTSGEGDLGAVADNAAIPEKHQLANPPHSIEEAKVSTQFGEGLLRLYFAKEGSLLKSGQIGQDSKTMKSFDSYIAVLVVRQGKRVFFAAAQDDNIGHIENYSEEKWKQRLKDSVQKFFATMVVSQ
jgi:hypothetical protein